MLVSVSLFTLPISADMGPKPSVQISFEGLTDELCYATLLSARSSTGPDSAWNGEEDHIYDRGNREIWQAFVDYTDSDGYYFLQAFWQINETTKLPWTYYPPSPFKLLVYYPEHDTYLVSGIYERYAFDSYYTVDMSNTDKNGTLILEQSYDYASEAKLLFSRVAATVVIELLIAVAFSLTAKGQMLLLLASNLVTQIILNILLNVINYRSGYLAYLFYYVIFELVVIAAETVLYLLFMNKLTDKSRKKYVYVLYALIANITSFVSGYIIIDFFGF